MWTRRQVLAQLGIAAAAIHTLDPHEICCGVDAHAATNEKTLFELKKVGGRRVRGVRRPRVQGELERGRHPDERWRRRGRHALEAVGRGRAAQGDPGRHQESREEDHQHPLSLGSLAGQRLLPGARIPRSRSSPPSRFTGT